MIQRDEESVSLRSPVHGQQSQEDFPQFIERQSIWPIGLRVRRVIVDLQKHAIHTRRYSCASQDGNELWLTSAHAVAARRQLNRMRRVEYHGRKFSHDRQWSHFYNRFVVAE